VVHGDLKPEGDETLFVELFGPSNATLRRDHGVGTILNDDTVRLGDVNLDGCVDGEDLAIWASGFGTTNANLDDGDVDSDGDVDGSDFITWQRNYGCSASSGVAAGSAVDSEAPDAGGVALFSTTDAAANSSSDAASEPLGPALARGGGSSSRSQDTSVPPTNRHGLSFESVDYAGWSIPQMRKALLQHLPPHRDMAIDVVISRLDERFPRLDYGRLHHTAIDTAFALTPEHDEMALSVDRWVAKSRHGDAPADHKDLEAAFDELRDVPFDIRLFFLAPMV